MGPMHLTPVQKISTKGPDTGGLVRQLTKTANFIATLMKYKLGEILCEQSKV